MEREILDKNGYFEKIDVTFIVKKRGDKIVMKYIIYGKYILDGLMFYFTNYSDMDNTRFETDLDMCVLILIEELEKHLFD